MHGSYTDTIELADSALDALKHAYDERQSLDIGDMILSAQGFITCLKQTILRSNRLKNDPYELPENNSAV
jgi:hypothetical protein